MIQVEAAISRFGIARAAADVGSFTVDLDGNFEIEESRENFFIRDGIGLVAEVSHLKWASDLRPNVG